MEQTPCRASPPPLTQSEPRTFYQYTHSFAERFRLSAKLRARYPDNVPVVFEPSEHAAGLWGSPTPSSSPSPPPPPRHTVTPLGEADDDPAKKESGRASEEEDNDNRPLASLGSATEETEGRTETLLRPASSSSCATATRSAGRGCAELVSLAQQQSRAEQEQARLQRERQSRWAAVAHGVRSQQRGVALKFVLPGRKTLAETIFTLRDRLAVDPHQSVFLSVGNGEVLAPSSSSLFLLYERYRDADGFLYVSYTLENTFG